MSPTACAPSFSTGRSCCPRTQGTYTTCPPAAWCGNTPAPFEAWSPRGLLVADDYRPRADAVIIRSEDIPAGYAEAEWPAQIVLAAVETVSTTPTAIRRDWEDKRLRYAAAGIPVYLVVDPNDAIWHLLKLDGSQYEETAKGIFGQEIPLPDRWALPFARLVGVRTRGSSRSADPPGTGE